jgi:hypothetical protein
MRNLFNELKALGLEPYPFKRKPKTGVSRFIDPRTKEEYTTYTTGYIRLTTDGRNAPINKRKDVTKPGGSYKRYKIIMLDSEILRLRFLIEYMTKKNTKIKKNGTKYYGQPEPKWITENKAAAAAHEVVVAKRMQPSNVEYLLDQGLPILEVSLFPGRTLCKMFIMAELPDSKGQIFLKMMSDGGYQDKKMADAFEIYLQLHRISYTRKRKDDPMDSRKFLVDGRQFTSFLEALITPPTF